MPENGRYACELRKESSGDYHVDITGLAGSSMKSYDGLLFDLLFSTTVSLDFLENGHLHLYRSSSIPLKSYLSNNFDHKTFSD